jgi:hypothetical protein
MPMLQKNHEIDRGIDVIFGHKWLPYTVLHCSKNILLIKTIRAITVPSRSLLDCVQKVTEPVQREDESDGADNESLASSNNSPDKTTMQMTTIHSSS